MIKPKILIIGHARHGKDTVAEMISQRLDLTFTSSSMFVAEEIIWKDWGVYIYDTFQEMFDDRVNHRAKWADMISAYNTPDKTKTASTMLERGNDMYVGMRRGDELEACKAKGVFDHIVWVDASIRLPPEPKSSMDLVIEDADYIISNNLDEKILSRNVNVFCQFTKESQHLQLELFPG